MSPQHDEQEMTMYRQTKIQNVQMFNLNNIGKANV